MNIFLEKQTTQDDTMPGSELIVLPVSGIITAMKAATAVPHDTIRSVLYFSCSDKETNKVRSKHACKFRGFGV